MYCILMQNIKYILSYSLYYLEILTDYPLEFLTFLFLYLYGELTGSRSEQIKQFLIWGILFGPVFFPLSLIFWHIYQIWKGEENFMEFQNIARLTVFRDVGFS